MKTLVKCENGVYVFYDKVVSIRVVGDDKLRLYYLQVVTGREYLISKNLYEHIVATMVRIEL